jgi:hypothetical protein
MVLPVAVVVDLKLVLELLRAGLLDGDRAIRQLLQVLNREVAVRVIHLLVMQQSYRTRQILIRVVEILTVQGFEIGDCTIDFFARIAKNVRATIY